MRRGLILHRCFVSWPFRSRRFIFNGRSGTSIEVVVDPVMHKNERVVQPAVPPDVDIVFVRCNEVQYLTAVHSLVRRNDRISEKGLVSALMHLFVFY